MARIWQQPIEEEEKDEKEEGIWYTINLWGIIAILHLPSALDPYSSGLLRSGTYKYFSDIHSDIKLERFFAA
ncbi:MAG: hypothetical protein HC810_02415 [Acaryochloridaceae cyanobacterium RL_2_7]|nr:hypothetical protein [Acaryochloridaceae cyanobacterium RL_2_7]